jgi:hypothetical protein
MNERDPPRLIQIEDLVVFTDLVMRPSPCSSHPFCGLEQGDEGILCLPYVTKMVPHQVVVEAMLELHNFAVSVEIDPNLAEMVWVEDIVAIEPRRDDPVVF